MSVRKSILRGRQVWLVEVKRDKGRFHRRRFFDRRRYQKTDALEAEAKLIAEYEASKIGNLFCSSNLHPGVIQRHGGSIPFAVFAGQYLKLQDESRSGFANKERNVRLHLLPYFGDTPLEQITRLMVDQFRRYLRTSPIRGRKKPRSPKTVNNILATLSTILNLAYDYELIGRVPKIKKEPVPKTDPQGLTRDEGQRLVAALDERWRPLIQTALLTGLRRGELYELRWGDVVFEGVEPYVRVTRSVVVKSGKYRVKSTKGMRGRTVPLCEQLVGILRTIQPEGARAEDLVFPGDSGEYLREDRMYKIVVGAGRKGLRKHVRPHMLRHTFASWAYQAGVPPQVVQMWLGHADVTTTQRYARLGPDVGRGWIERVAL